MEIQNVTLSIPKHILRKAKLLAVKRNTSLSSMLAHALEDLLSREEGYELARARHLSWLEQAPDLGTQGQTGWKREDLHER
jgi:hypothetical protein